MRFLKLRTHSLLNLIITKLQTLKNKISIEDNSKQLLNYEDLAPLSNVDKEDKDYPVYADAILNALQNEKVTNIALTGPYGSGKSSILRTFENNNPRYSYLNITLASFDENIKINQETRNVIELSILQQIFYRVKDSKIPDSRFKRIKKLTKRNQRGYTILLVLWIIISMITFKPELIQLNRIWNNLLDPYKAPIHNIGLLIFIFCIGCIIFHSLRLLRNSKVNKVNLISGEVELSSDVHSSILNKYLDEIVYFFEVTEYNTVIIEDLDRFKDPEIFTKLRELNTLLNQSEQIDRRIVFIYAVKDDMFLNATRTKFFEFIIPVIPIINPSNSGDVLAKKLEKIGMATNISRNFINDITLYVDDMRMVKNILNEFRIYQRRIGKKLNSEKLLAIIFYKNLYPTDFSELHADKGIIHTVFNEIPKYIKPRIEAIEKEINNLTNRIKIIDDTHLNDIKELKLVYLSTIFLKIPSNLPLYINYNQYNLLNTLDENIFLSIQQQRTLYYFNNYNSYPLNISFKDIEREVNPNRTYNERLADIEIKTKYNLEELKRSLDELKLERQTISSWTLKKVMSVVPLTVFSDDFLSKKLLVYLVRHGYIDESYYTYISYFYEGRLTKEDRDFLLSIKNHEALNYSYKLTQIDNIIQRLQLEEFYQTEILNFSFLNALMRKRHLYKTQLDALLQQLSDTSQRSVEFIDKYLHEGELPNDFFVLLCNKWKGLWDFIVLKSNYPLEKKNDYLFRIMQFVEIDDVFLMDYEGMLSWYIPKQSNFLQLFNDEYYFERIEGIIKGLRIKFEYIQDPSRSQKLFNFVYENNLYELNPKMIEVVFINKNNNGELSVADLYSANYSSILKSSCTYLIKYVQDNIEKYVDNVLLLIDTNNEEEQTTLISLLNHSALSIDAKTKILKRQNALITDITKIDKGVWDLLLSTFKLEVQWSNILIYYKENEKLNDTLVSYLNIEFNYKTLSKTKLNSDDKEFQEEIDDISTSIITCNDLSNQSYSYLLKSIPYCYSNLAIDKLSIEKIDSLIANQTIQLSVNNYNLLRGKFNGKHINLIEQWIDEFFKINSQLETDEGDFTQLLNSRAISRENKIILLDTIDKRTISKTSGLPDTIYHGVIKYNLPISKSLLFKLFGKLQNKLDEVNLLNSQFARLSSEDIQKALDQIGDDYSLISNQSLSELSFKESNQTLLKSLKERGIISRYSKEKNKLKIYYSPS